LGRAEGRREAILKMRKANMSDQQIASVYDLPVDAVRQLAGDKE
jgi:uncharacterized protein (DUF433 family)